MGRNGKSINYQCCTIHNTHSTFALGDSQHKDSVFMQVVNLNFNHWKLSPKTGRSSAQHGICLLLWSSKSRWKGKWKAITIGLLFKQNASR